MAKLNTHVAVQDENLRTHVFGPDDELPEWAVAKITNPHVWAEAPEVFATVELPDGTVIGDGRSLTTLPRGDAVDAGTVTETVTEVETETEVEQETESETETETLPIPPKGGPNASGEAWAAYAVQEIAARGLQIDIPAGTGRNDIIDALKSAGIPTE